MDPQGRGLIHFKRFDRGDDSLVVFACEVNAVPGQSLYIRAATVNPEAPEGHTQDCHVLQAPGVWADMDTLEDVQRAEKVQSIVRPNAIVVTGKFPHAREQLYVRTSEPIIDVDSIRCLNRRMIGLYGGDAKVANPSRLMRMPTRARLAATAWQIRASFT